MQSPSPSPEGSLKRCNESICSLLCPAQEVTQRSPSQQTFSPTAKTDPHADWRQSAQVQLRYGQDVGLLKVIYPLCAIATVGF